MTTIDELIEICRAFVESGGESIDKLFEAIMDYPLEDIPSQREPLLVRKLDDEAPIRTLTGMP